MLRPLIFCKIKTFVNNMKKICDSSLSQSRGAKWGGISTLRNLCGTVALALGALSLQADTVYVTSVTGSSLTPCPTFCETAGSWSNPGNGSGDLTAAPGVPTRTKTSYCFGGTPAFTLQPTLASGSVGSIYQIDTAHNSTATVSSVSADILFAVTTTDGDLSPSCASTAAFQKAKGGAVWNTIGYFTNKTGTATPTLTFTYISGAVNNTGTGRIYVDAFRFTLLDPCHLPVVVAPAVGVTGPLAANQTNATVTGVLATATNISVYANDVLIGQRTTGIVAGNNVVPTTGLVKDSIMKATQTISGCTSDLLGSGPLVGGGANPSIRAYVSLWTNSTYTGPIGANASAASVSYTLGANGTVNNGSQSAPTGGTALTPGVCWQSVTFDPSTGWNLNNSTAVLNADHWAALEGIEFSLDATDSGPYDIYIDRIVNGNTVVENFEGYTKNTTNTLVTPSLASFPNAGIAYLSAPNSALTSTNYSLDGTNSCRMQWQWSDNALVRWAHIVASGVSGGKKYPQIDVTQPLTIWLLILPAGQTNVGTPKISNSLASSTNLIGSNVTFSVSATAATGGGPLTYQWLKDGSNLGVTASTYTINAGQAADSGTYSVNVTDSTLGCANSLNAKVSFVDPYFTQQPASVSVGFGGTASFTVAVIGTPGFTYQWLKNGNSIFDGPTGTGSTVSGSGTTNLVISGVSTNDVGVYSVAVNGGNGSNTSLNANLTVADPAITVQPVASLVTTQNVSVSMNVTAIGSPTLTYQWKKGTTSIVGATDTSYTIAAPQGSDSGTYKVTVTNSVGSVTSSNVVLIVRENIGTVINGTNR